MILECSKMDKFEATVDGILYRFKLESFDNVAGYAKILIEDTSTKKVYQSYGYEEINGHIFISRWGFEYSSLRNNYISTKDLTIEIL